MKPVALITGASGGLGRVVAPAFVEAGYRVSAVSLDARARVKPTDGWLEIRADLSDAAAARRAVERTVEVFGRIDCLVHLAGAFDAPGRIEDTSAEVWDAMLAVNLRAAANMMRSVIPVMRRREAGQIVVIGSSTGLQPVITWSAFNAAIGGLCSLVQTAAAELRDAGITVNALLPTTIDTDVVRGFLPDDDWSRWVDPAAMASMMLWLCSAHGRAVSGALIPFIGRQPHPCHHWHGETD
ncbi:MAG TPA: SDR family oxidoreductase [Kofleriaceae bacterium]|nr:SDR family oxidoreductase [Kofleriaceae bacterium]